MKRCQLVVLALAFCGVSQTSLAAESYIGPAARFGTAIPVGVGSGNARADTIPSLTYLYTGAGATFVTATTVRVNQVNLAVQDAGTVTPFLAKYTGGLLTSGADFTLLLTGDAFTVAAGNSFGCACQPRLHGWRANSDLGGDRG